MGTLSAHVDDNTEKLAKKAASAKAHGKMSTYLRTLIEADVSGASGFPAAISENCLVEMTEQLVPFFTAEMKQACEGLDQPKALAAMLLNFAGAKSGASEEFLKTIEETQKVAKGLAGLK